MATTSPYGGEQTAEVGGRLTGDKRESEQSPTVMRLDRRKKTDLTVPCRSGAIRSYGGRTFDGGDGWGIKCYLRDFEPCGSEMRRNKSHKSDRKKNKMNENNEKKAEGTATGNTGAPTSETPAKKTILTKEVKQEIELEEVECEQEGIREFARKLNEVAIGVAESRDTMPTNPVRKNEVVLADECNGSMRDFKNAFLEGLVSAPSGLEKVGYRPNGFVKRDGSAEGQNVLAAKQFVVTVRRNGKWEPLPRFLASDEGGHFALSASQTLKGARQLASWLNYVWLKGGDASLLKKSGRKA